MSNIKSEFEKYFKENHADSFYSVDAALEMRGDDYIDFHAADLWALWQHQQSKVDELQKKNAWLSGVACRENKRANKLQEEKVSTTTLLGKTIQEKNELQKRVDDLTKVMEELLEEMKYPTATFEEVICRGVRELEQALKGESNESST